MESTTTTNETPVPRCHVCQNDFESPEFLEQHLLAKHEERIESAASISDYNTIEIEEKNDSEGEVEEDESEEEQDNLTQESEIKQLEVHIIKPNYNNRKRRVPLRLRDEIDEVQTKYQRRENNVKLLGNRIPIDVSQIASIQLKQNDCQQNALLEEMLIRVEDKLDSIIKHFNVPYQQQQTSAAVQELHKQAKSESSSQNVHVLREDQPQYLISDELIDQEYLKSRNRGNFAKNLVYACFSLDERTGRSCYGRRGGSLCGPKTPLDHGKLQAIKVATFKAFPCEVDHLEAIWKKECVIAIDTALRGEMRQRIISIQKPITNNTLNLTLP